MIKCPICKKEVAEGSPEFPFCSDRCRLIDLGKWANEEYKISSPASQRNTQTTEEDDE